MRSLCFPASFPPSLDLLLFCVLFQLLEDAIAATLHLPLTHLDNKGNYLHMLFMDLNTAPD